MTLKTAQLAENESKIPSSRKIKFNCATHSEGNKVIFTESRADVTRNLNLLDLENVSIIGLVSESVPDKLEALSEKYIETDSFTSTFIFAPKKTHQKSPILVWISSDETSDLYSPVWDTIFEREIILLVVKLKKIKDKDYKRMIDDVYSLCGKLAVDGLAEHFMLYAEGNLAGLAGLSSHLRNLGIFQSVAFKDAYTDLLDISNDKRGADFGYGDVKIEENCDQMLEDSPYHSDVLHHMTNSLFMSSKHEQGYQTLKFYSHLKHFSTADSNVYWTNMIDKNTAPLTALSFFWKTYCDSQKHVNRKQQP